MNERHSDDFEDFVEDLDNLVPDLNKPKPEKPHEKDPVLKPSNPNNDEEEFFEEFLEEPLSDHNKSSPKSHPQKLAANPQKSDPKLPVKQRDCSDDFGSEGEKSLQEQGKSGFEEEDLDYNEEFDPETPQNFDPNIDKSTKYLKEKASSPLDQRHKSTDSALKSIQRSPPQNKSPSLLDMKSKFNTILQHHLQRFDSNSNESPSTILQENRILLRLIRDFNGIVSQEIDRNMGRINAKVDFLHPESNPFKTLDPDLSNNAKILSTLRDELEKVNSRREEVSNRHFLPALKSSIEACKSQMKSLKQEIHRLEYEISQDGKRLDTIEIRNQGIPESLIKCQEIEQELAVLEPKVKQMKDKLQENQRLTSENEKRDKEADETLAEVTTKARDMGITPESEELERKYRGLKKKIIAFLKDNEVLRRRDEKILENWAKEKEDFVKVIEGRVSKCEFITNGITLEEEIIQEIGEKGELDEAIYQKIENLKEFGGHSLLGDRILRYNVKNSSFIEETRKKLAGNLSFISSKVEPSKKKEPSHTKREGIKESSEDLKETLSFPSEFKKNGINQAKDVKYEEKIEEKVDFETREYGKKAEKEKKVENPYKYDFKKAKKSQNAFAVDQPKNGEIEEKNEKFVGITAKSLENPLKYEEEKPKNALSFFKPQQNQASYGNKPNIEWSLNKDKGKKSFELQNSGLESESNAPNKSTNPAEFQSDKPFKTFNLAKSKDPSAFSEGDKGNNINVEKGNINVIKEASNKQNINEENHEKNEQSLPVKTFNFTKNKDPPAQRVPLELPGNEKKFSLKRNNDPTINKSITVETTEKTDQMVPKQPAITTKQPRNIFNLKEENEPKPNAFGKILEIPEITSESKLLNSVVGKERGSGSIEKIPPVKSEAIKKDENKPSWLLDDDDEDKPNNEIKPLTLNDPKSNSVFPKKKIQDPFEPDKLEEVNWEDGKGAKKALKLNMGKEAKNENINKNNDFFADFDF